MLVLQIEHVESCMMSIVQPRSEPTLGTVRPKSRLAKLLDVLRARLRHQVEARAGSCAESRAVPSRVAEWAWMVLWRTMSVRRCMTRIGVSW